MHDFQATKELAALKHLSSACGNLKTMHTTGSARRVKNVVHHRVLIPSAGAENY
jgi:hypothetical protein